MVGGSLAGGSLALLADGGIVEIGAVAGEGSGSSRRTVVVVVVVVIVAAAIVIVGSGAVGRARVGAWGGFVVGSLRVRVRLLVGIVYRIVVGRRASVGRRGRG